MSDMSAQSALSYRKAREAAWYSLLNLILKIPSKPLISLCHLLNSLMQGRTGWGQNLANTRYCKVTTPWLFCSVTMGLAELRFLLTIRIQIYWKISEMNPSEVLLLGSAVTLLPDLQMYIGQWHHDLFCKHFMI